MWESDYCKLLSWLSIDSNSCELNGVSFVVVFNGGLWWCRGYAVCLCTYRFSKKSTWHVTAAGRWGSIRVSSEHERVRSWVAWATVNAALRSLCVLIFTACFVALSQLSMLVDCCCIVGDNGWIISYYSEWICYITILYILLLNDNHFWYRIVLLHHKTDRRCQDGCV